MSATDIFDPEHIEKLVAPLRSQPSLIGLDVDGTLVDFEGTMDPTVRDVLNRVREAGHHVVIATGRALNTTLPIVRLAGVDNGWSVSSNGAVTTQITGGGINDYEIVETVTFDPEEALTRMYEAVPTARFAVEGVDGSFYATHSFDDLDFGLQSKHVPIEELIGAKKVIRVVVTAPDIPIEEFTEIVKRAGVHGCEYAVGWSSWLDMSAAGVTKASALESLRQKLGVRQDHTLAIGDGANDIEMLHWAAASFAMGQASPYVKAAAKAQTSDIANHGAVEVLKHLVG